jgi:hypothetical protein
MRFVELDAAVPMAILNCCVVELMPFVTRSPKLAIPTAVGVPEMGFVVPLPAPRESPVGKAPFAMLQVNGPDAVVFAISDWL